MCFSVSRWPTLIAFFGLCLLVCATAFVGCTDNITDQDDVFEDAAKRVEDKLLPTITVESQAVLRNLTNLLAALPEICATPLAELGTFVSSMPALGRPAVVELDDDDGEWILTWLDVVLGDNDDQPTAASAQLSVDIILQLFFRNVNGAAYLAVPFTLAPVTNLRLDGEPPSYAAGLLEGFFLSQDAASGQWRLRWRALNTAKVFEGEITAVSSVTGVVRRIDGGDVVVSTEVNSSANTITFEETTAVAQEKGITFFVRPGEQVRFELRIGPVDGTLQSITRDQLRLGPDDQLLPITKDPDDFPLASSLPINPTGDPVVTPGTDLGTFLWQDTVTNNCNAGEEQWRLRFSRRTVTATFAGSLESHDDADNVDALITRVSRVGACPATGSLSDQHTFDYECTLTTNVLSGYDLCVNNNGRLEVTAYINDVRDPRGVFVGENRAAPPSPLPFSILFDLDIEERHTERNLRFSDAFIVLAGNTDEDEDEQIILNPDQVSLDPLCRRPGEAPGKWVQPRVRITGEGEYGTQRFDGSMYELDQVQFRDENVTTLTDNRRFPDQGFPERGEIRLLTRIEDDINNSEITAFPENIGPQDGSVALQVVDVELNVDDVEFDFPNQTIILTVE